MLAQSHGTVRLSSCGVASIRAVRYDVRMISHLSGSVLTVKQGYLILDVGGVGYRVHCAPDILSGTQRGAELALFTHLAVREDAMELFGFGSFEDLELFQMLIGVSGIGPRSALGILSLDTIEKLSSAIAHGDVGYLTKVSGVGKKSAEKIVLELREKVGMLDITDTAATRSADEDVLEALKALGYRADEARDALRHVPDEIEDQGARIKEALRAMSRT